MRWRRGGDEGGRMKGGREGGRREGGREGGRDEMEVKKKVCERVSDHERK